MKKVMTLTIILFLAFAMVAFANDGLKYEVGKKVSDIKLNDHDGKGFNLEKTLADDGVKGVVFIFVSEQCPVSRACDERYVELTSEFKKQGVELIGINSNYTESIAVMKKHAEKNSYNFRILKDWNNVVADRFEALYTPHAYFIGKDHTLLYKGRIDDNHRNAGKVNERTLANAVSAYVGGDKIAVTETMSNGCEIKRVDSQ